MTEQEKQKLKDALIEAKHIHPTEYDDEDAFVGICFSDLVDIINSAMRNTDWHPASELPPVDEFGESEYLVVYDLDGYAFSAFYSRERGWCDEDGREIKWWCYPPKED